MSQTPIIRLFGPLQIEIDERVIGPGDFDGLKPKRLLEILLLAEGRRVSKARLADLLWPDDPPRNVGATIETYVSVLRRTLGRDWGRELVRTEAEAYRFDTSRVTLDVHRFTELLDRARRRESAQARPLLEDALELARGELLDDEPYADWLVEPRQRYATAVRNARLTAAEAALAEGDPHGALRHAERAITEDPLDERATRDVMLAHYLDANRHAALDAYEQCRSALVEELGVDPSDATEDLHRAILRDRPADALVTEHTGAAAGRASTGASVLRGRSMQILLVEDDLADARLIQEALCTGSVAMEVEHVRDGAAALDRLREQRAHPDLVLLDVGLPGRSGLEVLEELKQDPKLRRVPVVMLTSSAAEADVARSYDLHANSYLTKPVDLADFAGLVRALEAFWPLTARPTSSDHGASTP